MPEYTYKCEACTTIYNRRHSIKECLTDCEECEAAGTLVRIPSTPLILKKDIIGCKIDKPGKVVKDFIANAKEDLRKEKETLVRKEH